MPFSPDLIAPAVDRYRRERDRYLKLGDRVAEICRNDICDLNAIRAQVTFRVKSLKSFEGKLRRFSTRSDRNYKSVEEIFAEISDLAGVRIAAYQHEDCDKIVSHLRQAFRGPDGDIPIDPKDRYIEDRRNFYRAIHAQVCLPEDELVETYDNISDISCEIQVCTMIAHVWNEIEHGIGYQSQLGEPSENEVKLIEMLGHTVRQGDQQISMLLTAHALRIGKKTGSAGVAPQEQPFRDVHDCVSRLRDYKNKAMPDFSSNSGQLFDLLEELGLKTPVLLEASLDPFEPEALRDEMIDFSRYLGERGLPTLVLDAASCDLMLLRLLHKREEEILNLHKGKIGRGRGRPTRLHRISRCYREWRESRA